ncbi:Amino-acid acetyltransferase, mitochondrial [Neonectria ditissima]|uniref:Amino-acid acetyltransferase, mitochondrial n=1 Tax=Neonectria ditissima TaxID=78410 RepID=A0A0N8H5H7_9HYPO|nr:Amino-acid acetyltransferase, mitochondrial [Neonectria ditissima]
MTCTRAWKRASSCGQCLPLTESHIARGRGQQCRFSGITRGYTSQAASSSSPPSRLGSGAARHMSAASSALAMKRALDRDVIVSVLEVSATKRDAKGYLQKYTSRNQKHSKNPITLADTPKFVQAGENQDALLDAPQPLHVAIMKLRAPQEIDSETLRGVGKTLAQLRKLGLSSVVVVDCGVEESRLVVQDQVFRLCEAIDAYGEPGTRLVKDIFYHRTPPSESSPSFLSADIHLDDRGLIERMLRDGRIPVIPSIVARDVTRPSQPIESNKIVLALTRYFTGLQFNDQTEPNGEDAQIVRPKVVASVERIILLDPLGAIPATGRRAWHRFINIEQEYTSIMKELMGPDGSPLADENPTRASVTAHAANLDLAKDALAMLPSTSSALITTPSAAANTHVSSSRSSTSITSFDFRDMVTTRRKKNPLIHNLLTDKPVFSSSLPVPRAHMDAAPPASELSSVSTLLKRGMPLTVFPSARLNSWQPPVPGGPRLRLTDNCIDLPRLVHLIEDSFGRKLDVEDYLRRVNDNLAGIIIAGEYEGGAILTWEIPEGLDERTAYEQGRLVPYLDKFAVLKKSQGSGGVADVVFNAMVRGAFPDGVCWRSRKDNPVNKWYFERSAATSLSTFGYLPKPPSTVDSRDAPGNGSPAPAAAPAAAYPYYAETNPPACITLTIARPPATLQRPNSQLVAIAIAIAIQLLSSSFVNPKSAKMDFKNIGKNISNFGSQITPFASRTFQYTKEQLGQAEDKTQLPPDYIDLEKRVDALKQAHQKMLAVTSQYSNEAYDYPPNIKETFQDLGRTVSEKVTLLSGATSPAEAQAALVAPPTAKPQPKTFSHAVARASLSSSQLLHQHHTGAGEDPLATALEKYALASERVGEARLAQDTQIQSRFLAGWNTTLNTNLSFATRARKNVENSRLSLDAVKGHAKGTTFKLGTGSQSGEHPDEDLSPEAQEEIEKAEDEFVTQTEEAVGVMKNVLDTPEPLRNLAELIAAQIEYHKKAYEVLSELAPVVEGLQTEQEVGRANAF